ncbi:hypothetical protein [Nocardia sp. CS682]|uniref:hypothetical protein n=1 Tax=Nocardia sp. CS682 TaxID=1047172 RepID=UPI001074AC2E|nr:hypothetical protein [Nocardia sp. CS682]QBS40655.1 hypothetical protein DMB37_11490 [Nocardia sp. CS682]
MASPTYRDDWVDGLLDQGRAEGEARGEAKMLLRALVARGFVVSDDLRTRILSTSDTEQLEAWMDKAAVADSLDVVFGD